MDNRDQLIRFTQKGVGFPFVITILFGSYFYTFMAIIPLYLTTCLLLLKENAIFKQAAYNLNKRYQ